MPKHICYVNGYLIVPVITQFEVDAVPVTAEEWRQLGERSMVALRHSLSDDQKQFELKLDHQFVSTKQEDV